MNLQKSMSRWPATCLHPICPFPKGQQVKQKHCVAFCCKGGIIFEIVLYCEGESFKHISWMKSSTNKANIVSENHLLIMKDMCPY